MGPTQHPLQGAKITTRTDESDEHVRRSASEAIRTRLFAYETGKMGKGSAERGADPKGVVEEFVRNQNRPLNCQNAVDALQKYGIKKAVVQKSLDALVSEGTLTQKDYGKQKIYMLRQDNLPNLSPEETKELEEKVKKLQDTVKQESEVVGKLEQSLNQASNALSDEELARRIEELAAENEEMKERLAKIKESQTLVPDAEKKNIVKAFDEALNAWKKRKRMVNDIVDPILENVSKKPKQFYQDVGIETDTEIGIELRDIEALRPKKIR